MSVGRFTEVLLKSTIAKYKTNQKMMAQNISPHDPELVHNNV